MARALMDPSGRLTVPVAVRRALGIAGKTAFDVEAAEGQIVLRPVTGPATDDGWAYAPEHLELVRRAMKDSAEGRLSQMTEAERRAFTPGER